MTRFTLEVIIAMIIIAAAAIIWLGINIIKARRRMKKINEEYYRYERNVPYYGTLANIELVKQLEEAKPT